MKAPADKPRALDLFCGAGGSARGLQLAGFHVTGIDHQPQPRYCGDAFIQADAMEFPLEGYDLIWASPPCQAYAQLGAKDGRHPELIEPVRDRLQAVDVPWVIENILGAPLKQHILLCGSMFGLGVRRHRCFETSGLPLILTPPCQHGGEIRAYYGKPGWLCWSAKAAVVNGGSRKLLLRGSVDQARQDMGIDWMTWDELRESIPPVYAEFIGRRILAAERAA